MLKSPLTLNNNIKKIESFSVSRICDNYSDLGITDIERFFDSSLIDLYECVDTGYRFYYPFSSIGDAKFYESLSTNNPNYYSSRWEHKEALKFIEKDKFVLEIGSGFGAFLKLLRENNIQSKGLELNPHAVSKCKEEDLDVQEGLIQTEATINSDSHDVVCSFQVLEHITGVNSFIQSSINVLKKGGKLIVGVPNNNPYLFVNDKYHTLNLPPHHAGLWNKDSLKALQKIFPIQLEEIIFEPLVVSYHYFLKHQINNLDNKLLKRMLIVSNKFTPNLLQKVICKFVRGRNVLAVFKKI